MINGLLSSETKTTVELIDAEAKRQVVLREDIDEMVVSKKSLMPEGFEKQVPTDDIKNLLAFLTQPVKFMPLDLRKAATIASTKGMFYDENAEMERLVFPDWSPKSVGERALRAGRSRVGPYPERGAALRARGEVPAADAAIGRAHVQRQGQGDPFPERGQRLGLSLRAEGKRLDGGQAALRRRLRRGPPAGKRRPLRGLYPRGGCARLEARFPASRPAGPLPRGSPKKHDVIQRIELVKGPDQSAPIVLAVTVEVGDGT